MQYLNIFICKAKFVFTTNNVMTIYDTHKYDNKNHHFFTKLITK